MTLEERLVAVERGVLQIGIGSALILVPALIVVRLIEIVTRNLNIAGSIFNAMENELFILLVFLILGAGYASNSHVRVDILRERFSPRRRAWVELVGIVLFVLPFGLVVLWYGSLLMTLSLEDGERAAIGFGLPVRWLLVGAVPYGVLLLMIAMGARSVRAVLFLRGKASDPFEPGRVPE